MGSLPFGMDDFDASDWALSAGTLGIGIPFIGAQRASERAGAMAAQGSEQAANAYRQAQQQALAQQQTQYSQGRQDLAPFMAMQREAWERYMAMARNPDMGGLDQLGAMQQANTMALMSRAGLRNSSANFAAQNLAGQQLALEKAKYRTSLFNPFLNLGAPSQQAALAAQFGQQQGNTLMQGAQGYGSALERGADARSQGSLGGQQAWQSAFNAAASYAIAQSKQNGGGNAYGGAQGNSGSGHG